MVIRKRLPVLLCLCILLGGCAQKPVSETAVTSAAAVAETREAAVPQDTVPGVTAEIISTAAAIEDTTQAAEEEPPASVPETAAPAQASAAQSSRKMLECYQFALKQIAFEHVWPDGEDMYYDNGFGSIEDNEFALADIDGDGQQELLISYTTAPSAGMCQRVYSYDAAKDRVYLEAEEFTFTFFDNGFAISSASHNHTDSEFWPYALYAYDSAADSFIIQERVSGWDRAMAEVNWEGTPYPQDRDPDNVGTVYIMETPKTTSILSTEEYQDWQAEVFGDAKAVELNWQKLTEKNIYNFC